MSKYPFDKTCEYCSAVFVVKNSWEKPKRFCNFKCASDAKRTNPIVNCDKCTECGIDISEDKQKVKFCSRACSATYYNRIRDPKINEKVGNVLREMPVGRVFVRITQKKIRKLTAPAPIKTDKIKLKKSKQNIQNSKKKVVMQPKKRPSRVRHCGYCAALLPDSKKKYCQTCYPNIRHYRTLASFKFNVFNFPAEFDLELIAQHGWFSPNGYMRRNKQPNLEGVSRDHLLTVADGFKLKIDPTILAHPANCRIVLHNGPNGNNSKKSSSIALPELMERIAQWNSKYSQS